MRASRLAALALGLALLSAQASAAVIGVDASDRDWYRSSDPGSGGAYHDPDNTSSIGGSGHEFFVFAVPEQAGQTTTDIGALRDASAGQGGLRDLGDGTVFGTYVASAADNGSFIDIALDADAIAVLNDALGNLFAFGATMTALAPSYGQQPSASTNSFAHEPNFLSHTRRRPEHAAPEPGTAALLFAGALLTALILGRRRAAV